MYHDVEHVGSVGVAVSVVVAPPFLMKYPEPPPGFVVLFQPLFELGSNNCRKIIRTEIIRTELYNGRNCSDHCSNRIAHVVNRTGLPVRFIRFGFIDRCTRFFANRFATWASGSVHGFHDMLNMVILSASRYSASPSEGSVRFRGAGKRLLERRGGVEMCALVSIFLFFGFRT